MGGRGAADGERRSRGRQGPLQSKGARAAPSKSSLRVPATDDEIREKYLERAIRELNQLTHELQDCDACPRGSLMPVLGSGHPQADIFMLKYAPAPSEIEEGVAFYGRAGSALMKSFKRLGIEPLAVYGTVFVKCPVGDTEQSAPECRARVLDELAIVSPRIVVVMGEEALRELNELRVPLGRELEPAAGEIQSLTPSCEALYVPDIDASLDDEAAKRKFWQAFRALGDWYAELPPY
jgi:uracil-DNA glycosylase family 4